jgi:hypothetical protein
MEARPWGPVVFAAIAVGLLLAAGCVTGGYHTKPRVAVVDGDPIVQMYAPGAMPSLDHPHYVPSRNHTDRPFHDERVLGIGLGAPRAYPLGLLDGNEVVNDEAAGVPYVVARCALTDFVGVLDRRVAGQTLTFENSGALWRDMLVLRDRETGTYWSPASGRALSGPLEGERLRALPAYLTTAEAWEELLPESVCLDTGAFSSVPLRLKLYASSSWEGVSGEKSRDRRLPAKERVFFVAEGSESVAFTSAEIRRLKSVRVRLADRTLLLEWDGAMRSPRAYRVDESAAREERPVIPMYWFAALRHFPEVRTLSELTPGS